MKMACALARLYRLGFPRRRRFVLTTYGCWLPSLLHPNTGFLVFLTTTIGPELLLGLGRRQISENVAAVDAGRLPANKNGLAAIPPRIELLANTAIDLAIQDFLEDLS